MDAQTLAKFLRLRNLPDLYPAMIRGYRIKLWGLLPALIDGQANDIVHGMVYEAQSSAEERAL